jgi:hypothetical protein
MAQEDPTVTRKTGTAGRLLRVLVATALARGVFFMGGPGSDDPTRSSATITGSAGCFNYDGGGPCEQFEHDSPQGVRQFSATDSREADGDRSNAEIRVAQEHSADGELVSATISGRVDARVSGGGGSHALATYDIYLDEHVGAVSVTSHVSMQASGSELIVSGAAFDLDLDCGGRQIEPELDADAGGGDPDQARDESYSETFQADGEEDCSFSLGAWVGASSNRPAPGESGRAAMTFDLRITTTAEPEGCSGIHGTIRDGAEDDGHQNALPGVRVELRNETTTVSDPVVADDAGAYCIGGDVDPGTYNVRATLVDATHEPPLFETKHADGTVPNWVEVPVTADDFDPDRTVDVVFTSPESNVIADMANIHWQSARFVRWLTTTARISPQALRPFTITTHGAGTWYVGGDREVVIAGLVNDVNDSRFAERDEPYDNSPENGEWHEIGHHLGASIGVGGGDVGSCSLDVNHGGWTNPTTCDSLREGFAGWIATAASLDLDAGRGEGYADADYAQFGSLEANRYRPWSSLDIDGWIKQYEAMTVRQVLWDLADDTADDSGEVLMVTAASPDGDLHVARDRVALGSVNLLHLIAASSPDSMDDLYRGLVASPLVAENLKTPDVDLDGDGVMDIGALDEVFLLHGFHPLRSYLPAAHTVGDPFGRTDRPSSLADGAPIVERHHDAALPGAAIRLRNPSPADVRVVLEVAGPGFTERRSYLVAAASERIVPLEVPPYWPGLQPAGGLPPCETADPALGTTITVTVPEVAPASIGGCEYLHAVAAAKNGAAWEVQVAPGDSEITPGAGAASESGDSGPLLVVSIGVVVAVALGALAFLAFRRRSPSPEA